MPFTAPVKALNPSDWIIAWLTARTASGLAGPGAEKPFTPAYGQNGWTDHCMGSGQASSWLRAIVGSQGSGGDKISPHSLKVTPLSWMPSQERAWNPGGFSAATLNRVIRVFSTIVEMLLQDLYTNLRKCLKKFDEVRSYRILLDQGIANTGLVKGMRMQRSLSLKTTRLSPPRITLTLAQVQMRTRRSQREASPLSSTRP